MIVIAEDPHWAHTVVGLWVICGVLSFMTIEKVFTDTEDAEESEDEPIKSHVSYPHISFRLPKSSVNMPSSYFFSDLHSRSRQLLIIHILLVSSQVVLACGLLQMTSNHS